MKNFTEFTTEEQKDIADQLGYGDDIASLEMNDETFIPESDFEEYAEQLMDDCYNIPETLVNYIDYKAFARDLEYDYSEVEIDGITYKTRSY